MSDKDVNKELTLKGEKYDATSLTKPGRYPMVATRRLAVRDGIEHLVFEVRTEHQIHLLAISLAPIYERSIAEDGEPLNKPTFSIYWYEDGGKRFGGVRDGELNLHGLIHAILDHEGELLPHDDKKKEKKH